MNIRKAQKDDIDEVLAIYEHAREFMRNHGNLEQWKDGYPYQPVVEDDIKKQKLYICQDNGKIACVFFFDKTTDPTYLKIKGKWLNDDTYGVVHRIAAAPNTKGAATFALNWAYSQCLNLKIDTHEDNIPMQSLLKKLGFEYCGIINLANGDERWAYQKEKAVE